MSDDEEIDEELDKGAKAASDLVDHLISMGADRCAIPVVVADEAYEIIVQHKPVIDVTK